MLFKKQLVNHIFFSPSTCDTHFSSLLLSCLSIWRHCTQGGLTIKVFTSEFQISNKIIQTSGKIQAKLVTFQAKLVKFQAKFVKFQAKFVKFQAKIVKFQAKVVMFQAKMSRISCQIKWNFKLQLPFK